MSVNDRLARIEQKLEDMLEMERSRHEEQRTICDQHFKAVSTLQTKINDLEHLRWYFRGVAAMMACLFVYFKEEIKRKLRGMP